ncbi:MAG TPA: hypothetical protein VED63_00140, partial [Acidimicrobiales bacterium]|nr:hypothetical protein [Acidimicrobiales bacterium]
TVPSVGTPTPPGVSTSAPTNANCRFSPGIGALATGVSAGSTVAMDCTGFPDDHPYLLVEMSLTVALDPAAAPLLAGDVTSVAGIEAVAAAVPEINAAATVAVTSSSSGDIDYTYTVPTSEPPGQGASCPPSTQEFNSGVIGCVVAMIDPVSGGDVSAGTFVLNYAGQNLFPPQPTAALSVTEATVGQSVSVSDANNATTYWWLATLADLYNGLSGGNTTAPVPVVIRSSGKKTVSSASVTPASYSNGTFTPPLLSGNFSALGRGRKKVNVSLTQELLGIPLTISASAKVKITK